MNISTWRYSILLVFFQLYGNHIQYVVAEEGSMNYLPYIIGVAILLCSGGGMLWYMRSRNNSYKPPNDSTYHTPGMEDIPPYCPPQETEKNSIPTLQSPISSPINNPPVNNTNKNNNMWNNVGPSGGGGGKTVKEYCDESDILTTFIGDPKMRALRINYDELSWIRLLSKGGYGEVWLGQLGPDHVAIKRLLPEKKHITRSIEQFSAEIRLMSTFKHDNIVSFLGVSFHGLQDLCAVSEYMDLGDLDDVLKKYKNEFTWPKEKIAIAQDIAEGLVYLHSMKPIVIHRDLKSKNVLLNKRLKAKLSDFGVSRRTRINETMTSGVGTLLWTAPEIIEGKKYSHSADIYSLGVVLSEIDTCEPPFSDMKGAQGQRLPGMQLVQMVRLGQLKCTFRDDCPPELKKLAQQCTQLEPSLRPNSMQVAFTLNSIILPALRANAS